jgi:hypothetical protein
MKIVRFGAALAGLLGCLVAPALAVPPSPAGLAVADLDQDPLCPGCDDVVVAVPKSNVASIRIGRADGTFNTPIAIPVPRPIAVATADCDADGDLDVFVLGLGGDLHVLENQLNDSASGVFLEAPGSPISTGRSGTFVLARDYTGAALDLDGDANHDLVVTDAKRGSVVLHGQGGCAFTVAPDVLPAAVAAGAGPFDANPGLDLALSRRRPVPGVLAILLNDGSGNFPTVCPGTGCTQVDARPRPQGMVVRDFNGNGVADVLISYSDAHPVAPSVIGLELATGQGAGNVSAFNGYGSGGAAASGLVVGDFAGSSYPDIVVANRRSGTIATLLGTSDFATFDFPTTTPVGKHPVAVAAGQFNSGTDAFLDVVVLYDRSSLALCLGDGAGGFSCSPAP